MSAFDDDLAAAAGDLLGLAGNTVSYQPIAGGAPIGLTAYRVGEMRQVIGEDGMVHITFDECDYTMTVDSLDGATPKAGDVITEEISGVEYRFEVLPVSKGAFFTWVDPGHTQLTVRVKRIA